MVSATAVALAVAFWLTWSWWNTGRLLVLGQFLGAAGTVAAFSAGFYLLREQLKQFRESDQDRNQAEERRIRRDAERTAGWMAWGTSDPGPKQMSPNASMLMAEGEVGNCAFIVNAGDTPMFDCRGFARLPDGSTRRGYTVGHDMTFCVSFGTVAPGQRAARLVSPVINEANLHMLSIEFRDSAGRWWWRNEAGKLNEGHVPPP